MIALAIWALGALVLGGYGVYRLWNWGVEATGPLGPIFTILVAPLWPVLLLAILYGGVID